MPQISINALKGATFISTRSSMAATQSINQRDNALNGATFISTATRVFVTKYRQDVSMP